MRKCTRQSRAVNLTFDQTVDLRQHLRRFLLLHQFFRQLRVAQQRRGDVCKRLGQVHIVRREMDDRHVDAAIVVVVRLQVRCIPFAQGAAGAGHAGGRVRAQTRLPLKRRRAVRVPLPMPVSVAVAVAV
jgi:hypothetical protein